MGGGRVEEVVGLVVGESTLTHYVGIDGWQMEAFVGIHTYTYTHINTHTNIHTLG